MKDEIPEYMRKAREYVVGNKESLTAKYGDNYIAVGFTDSGEAEVFGSDPKKFVLWRKMSGREVLVGTVKGIITPRIVDMPSPEFVTR